jgi:hypothetical protein
MSYPILLNLDSRISVHGIMARWLLPLLLAGCAAPPDPGESRRRNLDFLREYIQAGRFPRNEEVEGETPIFVDARGAPCAVAYLMLKAGREDLVRQVVEEDNYIRIGEVREGPVLDWIRGSGLSQEECAAIQPSYRRRRLPAYVYFYGASKGSLSNPGYWVIPESYALRPHLIEPLRVSSHLSRAAARLEIARLFVILEKAAPEPDDDEVSREELSVRDEPEQPPFAPGWRALFSR